MPYEFINQTGVIGTILQAGTESLTGSISVSLIMIFLFLLAIAFMFQIPLEYTSIIMLPISLSVGAFYSNILVPLITILIYLSMIIAKNWLFK